VFTISEFTVGGLTLDEDEYRTYMIVQEAIKSCPMQERLVTLEKTVYGEKGKNGIRGRVGSLENNVKDVKKVVSGLIGALITLVVGSAITVVSYILTRI